MAQAYSDPNRESDPYALPDVETFRGYRHECANCGTEQPLFPDYYGVIYTERARCHECHNQGSLKCIDTKAAWYYWYCFPGCLPDSDPIGPFETESEALAAAQDDAY